MTTPAMTSTAGTSALGPMMGPLSAKTSVTILTLCHLGTSTPVTALDLASATSAGLTAAAPAAQELPAATAGEAIGEVRRLSGLTWEQLADLLGVSRRTLHFWASGKPVNAANEERLHRVLGLLQAADRGASDYNRAALLAPDAHGVRPFDLLTAGEYEAARHQLGVGAGRRLALRPLSEEAAAARRPLPPADLVGALQDPIHVEPGRGRAAKSVRVRRGGEQPG
jgi:transcriptional regulator with XRE-family HTH domain